MLQACRERERQCAARLREGAEGGEQQLSGALAPGGRNDVQTLHHTAHTATARYHQSSDETDLFPPSEKALPEEEQDSGQQRLVQRPGAGAVVCKRMLEVLPRVLVLAPPGVDDRSDLKGVVLHGAPSEPVVDRQAG